MNQNDAVKAFTKQFMDSYIKGCEIEACRNVAESWREQHAEFASGGFVLVDPLSEGISGWKAQLDRPETVCPGVYAFGSDGSAFVAKGGDEVVGARRWKEV